MPKVGKNIRNWSPSETDYVLVFCDVDGLWIECSNNLPKFNKMLLADYLAYMNIQVPDYTQFLRIMDYERNIEITYRAYNMARVQINVSPLYY